MLTSWFLILNVTHHIDDNDISSMVVMATSIIPIKFMVGKS